MDIDVKIGDVQVAKDPDNLSASGIGSCLAIILYDPKLKLGALAHAMLPTRHCEAGAAGRSNPNTRDTKYVDNAIDEILTKMLSRGAKKENIEAKLIGGANMFSAFKSDIGNENVLTAKEKLKKEGIKIIGEAVGGSQGRSVEFSVSSGIVTVKIKF